MLRNLPIPTRIIYSQITYFGLGEHGNSLGFIYLKVKDQKLPRQTAIFTTLNAIIRQGDSSNVGNNFKSTNPEPLQYIAGTDNTKMIKINLQNGNNVRCVQTC